MHPIHPHLRSLALGLLILHPSPTNGFFLIQRKFVSWYPQRAVQFGTSSTVACNKTLAQVYTDMPGLGLEDRMENHADCILENTTELNKANVGSASVLLGLTPTILSNLGSTLSESSAVAVERPLLSLLLALGSPAISVKRPFAGHDIFGAMRNNRKDVSWTFGQSSLVLISVLEYTLAGAAFINTLVVAIELGVKTLEIWFLPASWFPLLWVTSTLASRILAACKLKFCLREYEGNQREGKPHKVSAPTSLNTQQFLNDEDRCKRAARSDLAEPSVKTGAKLLSIFKEKLKRGFKTEVTPCLSHREYDIPEGRVELFPEYVTAVVLELYALVHIGVGTAIFSSLLFICIEDAARVFARLFASAVVVQSIMAFELWGLRSRITNGNGRGN